MKKILVFGASDSSRSINRQLAIYAARQLPNVQLTILDLRDFEMPLYGVDRQAEIGIPDAAREFLRLIGEHDAVVVSFAEYNSGYSTAFKNLQDWASRIRKDIWQNRPMFMLSTSPGGRGGANVMSIARKFQPFMGAQIISSFSLPYFRKYFSPEKGILDPELDAKFRAELDQFVQALQEKTVSVD